MRKTVALVAFALLLGACGNLFDTAAAVVAGKKITVREIDERLDEYVKTDEYRRLTSQGQPGAIKRQYQQAFLAQLIRRAVLAPRAEELGVEVTDQEVSDRIEQIKNDFDNENAFEEALKEQGLDLGQLETLVRDGLLEDEVKAAVTKNVAPTREELRAYYDRNVKDFTRTRSSHILVDNKALAQELAIRLQKTPSDKVESLFATLAKRYSTDERSAAKGGDLGFTSPGDLVPEFEKAAAELEVGEVSDPVRSQFGYHVILVTAREATPFDEAAQTIAEKIGTEREDEVWQKWLDEAYLDADIKVNSRYGELDPESHLIVDPTARDIPGAVETPSPTSTASP